MSFGSAFEKFSAGAHGPVLYCRPI